MNDPTEQRQTLELISELQLTRRRLLDELATAMQNQNDALEIFGDDQQMRTKIITGCGEEIIRLTQELRQTGELLEELQRVVDLGRAISQGARSESIDGA